MGMFDYYKPDGDLRCPQCGTSLDEWQGKNGPNELLLWKQGCRNPVGHLADAEIIEPVTEPDERTLPESFELHTICQGCHKRVEAVGHCVEGVWISSTIL